MAEHTKAFMTKKHKKQAITTHGAPAFTPGLAELLRVFAEKSEQTALMIKAFLVYNKSCKTKPLKHKYKTSSRLFYIIITLFITHTHTHARAHTHARTHTHTLARAQTVHTHKHTHKHTHTHTHTRATGP